MFLRFDALREFDRALEQARTTTTRPSGLPMDAYRLGESFVVQFDLPGVDPATVDISIENNTLTVAAERSFGAADEATVVARERRHGKLRRQLYLGRNLDANGISAGYEHGVLTLTIPVSETAKPRKISVDAAAPSELATADA